MFMVTGGKVGSIIGRRRAFAIGCVIYGAGSLTTALAPNLAVLVLGWSLLEGIGAALIMPAIVASGRQLPPAVARGPTGWSWRPARSRSRSVPDRRLRHHLFLVAVGVRRRGRGGAGILVLARRVQDAPPSRPKLDLVGTVLSAAGLGLAVFGVLRSSEWGWIQPKPTDPTCWGCRRRSGSSWAACSWSGCSWNGSGDWRSGAPSRWSDPSC